MKIYQIHEYGGEWEDAYDYIVASYLSEDKALAEKERLEKENAEMIKCNDCPLYYCPSECDLKCGSKECDKQAVNSTKKYCNDYEPERKYKRECKNHSFNFRDSLFKIEEREVIE